MPSTTPISLQQRIQAAIRGAFIADAASMGLHWIYNPQELLEEVDHDVQAPEFQTPPRPRFYSAKEFPGHYAAGMLSPYGEQLAFVCQQVVNSTEGNLDGEELTKAMVQWAGTFGGRPDSATKTLVENFGKDIHYPNSAADDKEAHIFTKIVPVTCRFAGQPELIENVKTAISFHQGHPAAMAFGMIAAKMLEAVLLGQSLADAVDLAGKLSKQEEYSSFVQEPLQHAMEATIEHTVEQYLLDWSHEYMKDKPEHPFYDMMGRSCDLPGSFLGPLFLLRQSPDFATAIRKNILGAGDQCSRGIFLGALLGAAAGEVPWIDRLDESVRKQVDSLADKIAESGKPCNV